MEWWQILIVVWVCVLVTLALAAFVLWRQATTRTRELGRRLGRLPWRQRFELAVRLMSDNRVPLPLRAVPPLLVLYLATPVDLIPDVIPILGQLDDLLVVAVALGLLTRFVPIDIVEAHIASLEAEAEAGRAAAEES